MRRKWLLLPVLFAGMLFLSHEDSQGQPPGGGFPGGGPGGFGGRGGFSRGQMDPEVIWNFMSKGQPSINLNDPQFAGMRQRMEQKGQAIPPNGILTKERFVADFRARQSQQQGGPGAPPMVVQGGSPDGKPTIVMQGGPPGMGGMPGMMTGNSDDAAKMFFARYDRNQDGRITPDEASGGLRDRFQQYDTNRDGTIDLNEYKVYMQDRFASRGQGGRGFGGPGGSTDMNASMSQGPNGAWGSNPGGWGGNGTWGQNPGGWPGGGDPSTQVDRRRGRGAEEDAGPVAYRFGKLPKELPSWWGDLDTDQDGQVGLYEWRRASRKTADFVEMDLNGDGYLTPDEWLRFQKIQLEKKSDDSADSPGGGGRRYGGGPPGGGDRGGDRTDRQRGGKGDRGGKDGGPPSWGGKGNKDGGGPPWGGKGSKGERGKDGGSREDRREGKRNPFTGN